jgi:DNA invertase Pin-like site-specific DNA recombinase
VTTAAIYARISEDDLGLEKGVSRQLEDARHLAAQRGWDVVEEYQDNDISALNGAARQGYKSLMADAESGRFERIIAWQTSRLWRNRQERAQAITRLAQLRIGVASCRGPELDLTTASGRMIAGIMGEFDSAESEIKAERVARASLQRAQEGRANGDVLYGWQRQYLTDALGRTVGFEDIEKPDEAAIVREIIDRLLARESARAIVQDLNAREVPVPSRRKGIIWNSTSLRAVVLRPANVGLRLYRGHVIGPAAWPAIVDQDKHDRVAALLSDPGRRQARDGRRKHLLTFGIGQCGVCGGSLRPGSQKRVAGRHWFYTCERFCTARDMVKVDDLVRAVVIERLSQPDARSLFDSDDSAAQAARESAEAIRARLDSAADAFANGDIDGEQLRRITARLRPDLDAVETELRRHRKPAVPDAATGLLSDKAASVWDSLPVTAKRAVLEALNLTVVIMPRKQGGGRGFEPTEIEFSWEPSR